MNIAWVHYRAIASGSPLSKAPGVARGYFKLAFFLYRAMKDLIGQVHITDAGEGEQAHPKMAFHLCPPHMFRPIVGKINVIFSMWEGDALHQDMVRDLGRADYCVVPSRYCQEVWRHHGLEAAYVPLGVAPYYLAGDTSRPVIQTPNLRMRYLWLGSKLERKGWEFIAPAWQQAFGNVSNAQLYIKTIGDGTVRKAWGGKVIMDQRDIEEVELESLYRSASVFMFPSYGEGFGLPALEAMATGALVIAPAHSGLTEFINPQTAIVLEPGELKSVSYGGDYVSRFPTAKNLGRAITRTYKEWGKGPLETIRRTGANYAQRFTWRATAERLATVLEAIAEKKAPEREAILV